MRVFIRTDASVALGTGHVMRCLTLADKLKKHGAEISFICRTLPGDLNDYIKNSGYDVYRLQIDEGMNDHIQDAKESSEVIVENSNEKIDWVIVDHYGLDEKWESVIRPHTRNIMVIDDLANRKHDCDILLDQNLVFNFKNRYQNLVPKKAIQLLGPSYALLRPDFFKARKRLTRDRNNIERLLISFGGTDPKNQTKKAINVIQQMNKKIIVDVVIGENNPYKMELKSLCDGMPNTTLYHQTNEMAKLIMEADLAITAGGSTTWERFCLGLPAIIISVSDNQIPIAQESHRLGIDYYLGPSNNVTEDNIKQGILRMINYNKSYKKAQKLAMNLVDGQGTERVLNIMLKES